MLSWFAQWRLISGRFLCRRLHSEESRVDNIEIGGPGAQPWMRSSGMGVFYANSGIKITSFRLLAFKSGAHASNPKTTRMAKFCRLGSLGYGWDALVGRAPTLKSGVHMLRPKAFSAARVPVSQRPQLR